MKRIIPYILLILSVMPLQCTEQPAAEKSMFFCMAADEFYYTLLLNLIGSIHRVNFDQIGEIAVFDIGFTPQQRQELSQIEKVHVYDVEITHPEMLKRFKARRGTRNVPGWYAWKPVIIKQALEKFPYVLYLDSAMAIINDLGPVFAYIRQKGHLLFESIRTIKWMATDYIIKKFNLNSPKLSPLLNAKGIDAFIIGLTRDHYHDYILPLYELSKDLRNFAEDGSTQTARHDQTLFSIQAYYVKLAFTKMDHPVFTSKNKKFCRLDLFDIGVRFRKDSVNMIPYIRYRNK